MYGHIGTLEDLEGTLKHLDALRVSIMREINSMKFGSGLGEHDKVKPEQAHPLSRVTHEVVNNIPYFQFSYDGMLPHFNENDNEHLSIIRNYYLRATMNSYNYNKIDYVFENAVILFVQYFKNNIIRDLENRNKKYIQDAIRSTGLIRDDHWGNVWNADLGFKDPDSDHVQVYLVSQKDFGEFYSIFLKKHHEMKQTFNLKERKKNILTEINAQNRYEKGVSDERNEADKLDVLF